MKQEKSTSPLFLSGEKEKEKTKPTCLEEFECVPYEEMLGLIKNMGLDDIQIDHENKTLRFIAEAIIDLKFFEYGQFGDVNYRFNKGVAVEPDTNSMIRCNVDGCKDIAKYKIVEAFNNLKHSKKPLFTRTYCYCQKHNKLDDIAEDTYPTVTEI